MAKRKYRHPKHGDLYAIIDPEMLELFARMRQRHGTWREVAYLSNTRLKVLRRYHRGTARTISMTKLDEIITTTGVGSLRDYVWYEADDLVEMGVWDPPAPNLNERRDA